MNQNVYTLLCERDMPMARITVPGILKFLSSAQKLYIYDDGSLRSDSVKELLDLSTQVIVTTRREREDIILEKLANKPKCIHYRNTLPFAFKLLDIPLMVMDNEGSRYTYTDSDIIYLRNCEGYFNRTVNTYLRTDAVKLSIRLKDVFLGYGWKVPYKFNAGFFSFDTKTYDLDFIEHYLGLPEIYNIPSLSEQTCWALLFERSGQPLFCPSEKQFVCREDFVGPDEQTLAIHLIANLKDKCEEWSRYIDNGSPNLFLEFEPSRNVTVVDWVKKSAARFL